VTTTPLLSCTTHREHTSELLATDVSSGYEGFPPPGAATVPTNARVPDGRPRDEQASVGISRSPGALSARARFEKSPLTSTGRNAREGYQEAPAARPSAVVTARRYPSLFSIAWYLTAGTVPSRPLGV
jgi:hypothetical protein